jgi:hypothetical protein
MPLLYTLGLAGIGCWLVAMGLLAWGFSRWYRYLRAKEQRLHASRWDWE